MLDLPNSNPGTYHLANNPRLYEPQRTNNFELHITGLENLVPSERTVFDTDSIQNASEVIRLSVAKVGMPSFQQGVIQIRYGNNIIKFAGTPDFQTTELQLNDYIGADTQEIMRAWQALSYNVKTQKVGKAIDYKKTAYLMEYTPDYQLVRTWRLVGCWIANLTFDEYNYDSSERKMMNAQIVYDYAYPEKAE